MNSVIWHTLKSARFSQHWQHFRVAPNSLTRVLSTIAALSLQSAQTNLSCLSARLINSDESAGITLLGCIWFVAPSSPAQHWLRSSYAVLVCMKPSDSSTAVNIHHIWTLANVQAFDRFALVIQGIKRNCKLMWTHNFHFPLEELISGMSRNLWKVWLPAPCSPRPRQQRLNKTSFMQKKIVIKSYLLYQ